MRADTDATLNQPAPASLSHAEVDPVAAHRRALVLRRLLPHEIPDPQPSGNSVYQNDAETLTDTSGARQPLKEKEHGTAIEGVVDSGGHWVPVSATPAQIMFGACIKRIF
ncbi:hypothetical protein [Arthrobacter sp. ISL-72]|uniref:hypothetical protein n=1 Tax=Arthrobacter sp. ISL-72 TaxID=2819114 RepID=UPI001BEBB251|nr:hypothetical protein [Arthrobacter sp. ISL-72]MBT2597922.1 hypothetical protein [Arthrobacter sp. ISL-72]